MMQRPTIYFLPTLASVLGRNEDDPSLRLFATVLLLPPWQNIRRIPSRVKAPRRKLMKHTWRPVATYLTLGVVPIVQAKERGSAGLFDGLPVIEAPDLLSSNRTREDYVTIMKDCIQSPAFQNTNFDGWERLFLKHWRRRLLKHAGRDKDIVRDEQGRECYQAWKHTVRPRNSRIASYAVTGQLSVGKEMEIENV
jgi:hypothetical protein